jgi:outer membrane protein assembly factor BamA
MKLILIAIIISLFFSFAYSEETGKSDFFVLPLALYTSETSLAFGGLIYYSNRPAGRAYLLSPDAHYINGIYSLNKQVQILYRSEFYLHREKYFLSPEIDYEKWPGKFFGIGNNTKSSSEEKYTNDYHALRLRARYNINDKFAAGIIAEYENFEISEMETDGMLITNEISGSEKFNLNNLGMIFYYDTRDITTYSTRGEYFIFELKRSDSMFGSDYDYTSYRMDLRKFIPLSLKSALALQGILSHIDSQAPFQRLTKLGHHMRGFETNRYIDNSLMMLRAEYRIFPWQIPGLDRLGFVVFAESGQVAPDLGSFKLNETKLSIGGGLRLSVIPAEKLNLRFDFGLSKDMLEIQIMSYEVF